MLDFTGSDSSGSESSVSESSMSGSTVLESSVSEYGVLKSSAGCPIVASARAPLGAGESQLEQNGDHR